MDRNLEKTNENDRTDPTSGPDAIRLTDEIREFRGIRRAEEEEAEAEATAEAAGAGTGESAGEHRHAPSRKKRLALTALFVVLNVIVVAWTAVSEYRRGQGAESFRNIELRWIYLLPALGCLILSISAGVVIYAYIMKKTCGYVRWKLCRRTFLLGRYYDNITPSGIGGQPYQIYYMKKNGIPAAQSASIPIAGFLSMQYSFIILALVCAIFGNPRTGSEVIRVASWIGIVCYSLFPTTILFFTLFPAFSEKVTRFVVSLLSLLHIVKDREKTAAKFTANVEAYSSCLKGFLKRADLCVIVMAFGLIYQAALMCVPYFVIRTFGGQIGIVECFVTVVTIYAAITFIPTPGNAGAAEGVFYAVFSVLTSGYIFWATLTWRFMIYYVYIIYGIAVYILDYARSRRRKRTG